MKPDFLLQPRISDKSLDFMTCNSGKPCNMIVNYGQPVLSRWILIEIRYL
jgi:hypothetical protein